MWVFRYLDSSEGDWKTALDHWLVPHPDLSFGRGILFTKTNIKDLLRPLPPTLIFMREAIRTFHSLNIEQPTDPTSREEARAEPLWHSHRFPPPLAPTEFNLLKNMGFHQIRDLFHRETNKIPTGQELKEICHANKYKKSGTSFTATRWDTILNNLTNNLPNNWFSAANSPNPPITPGDIVEISHNKHRDLEFCKVMPNLKLRRLDIDARGLATLTDSIAPKPKLTPRPALIREDKFKNIYVYGPAESFFPHPIHTLLIVDICSYSHRISSVGIFLYIRIYCSAYIYIYIFTYIYIYIRPYIYIRYIDITYTGYS